jgi:succinyl-CoA synthetase alpha subunit
MSMSSIFDILYNDPNVLVQGITGTHGSFHTKAMLEAGTSIVAGVTPGKGGESVSGVPVYNTVEEARKSHDIHISVVFVPAPHAKAAILEAIEAGIGFIVVITEHIPVNDVIVVLAAARKRGVTLIGPNCPGILAPGNIKLGIIPAVVGLPAEEQGGIAVVSRSGTLTYEAAASLSAEGIGQRIVVGIGGDRLRGTSFVDCLRAFESDDRVTAIVLIGEIGGQDEQAAAAYITEHVTKPVFAYVVGHSAPPETQLGHAGAIMGGENESAAAKTAALQAAGAVTADSLPELIQLVRTV